MKTYTVILFILLFTILSGFNTDIADASSHCTVSWAGGYCSTASCNTDCSKICSEISTCESWKCTQEGSDPVCAGPLQVCRITLCASQAPTPTKTPTPTTPPGEPTNTPAPTATPGGPTPTPTSPTGSCPIIFTPSQVDNEYNTDITIEIPNSSTCKFQIETEDTEAIDYTTFFCYEPNLGGSRNVCAPQSTTKAKDSKTLISKLDLITSDLGDKKYGSWYVTICLSRNKDDCKKNKNILTTGSISVLADTPPSDLPTIDINDQTKCIFKVGDSVTLTAKNINPGKVYQWWWNGNWGIHEIGKATGTSLIFTIPGSETTEAGVRNVCVEDTDGNRTRGQSQHCISLEFTAATPTGDTSCQAKNSGTDYFKLHEDDPLNPLPPCAEWKDPNNKEICLSIDTAVGPIKTDPKDFVTNIYSLVLGLAGGIALILILISGYRFIASHGNPEALQGARDQLISAIIGLLFIIFSFVILQVIGVDILHIPGFG